MKRVVALVPMIVFGISLAHAEYKRTPDYSVLSKHTDMGVQIANDLVEERREFARQLIKPSSKVTADMAKKICIAVAGKAKRIATENDIFIIRLIAEKYRNPSNMADEEELKGLEYLDKNRQHQSEYWTGVRINKEAYYLYMKPVFAEKSCLACHGDEEKRPAFIKESYPDDSSYGFQVGDIMGGVAVYTWKGF